MLGDVGEPDLVRPRRGEHALYPVIVHRRPGTALALPAPALADLGGDALLRTQPPHAPLAGDMPVRGELVREEAIPERGIVVVGVAERVDQVGVVLVAR